MKQKLCNWSMKFSIVKGYVQKINTVQFIYIRFFQFNFFPKIRTRKEPGLVLTILWPGYKQPIFACFEEIHVILIDLLSIY